MVKYQQSSCNMYSLNLLQKNIKTKHPVITWLEIIQAVLSVGMSQTVPPHVYIVYTNTHTESTQLTHFILIINKEREMHSDRNLVMYLDYYISIIQPYK